MKGHTLPKKVSAPPSTQCGVHDTPTKRDGAVPSKRYPRDDPLDELTLWGEPLERSSSEERLMIKATQLAEGTDETKVASGLATSTPQGEKDGIGPVPDECSASASAGVSVQSSDTTDSKFSNQQSQSKVRSKIKRAFSFIISPPSEKNKGRADGPVSKKKNTEKNKGSDDDLSSAKKNPEK